MHYTGTHECVSEELKDGFQGAEASLKLLVPSQSVCV